MRYLQGLKQRLSKKDFFDFLYMDRRYYGFHVQKTCFYHRKFYLRTSTGHFHGPFFAYVILTKRVSFHSTFSKSLKRSNLKGYRDWQDGVAHLYEPAMNGRFGPASEGMEAYEKKCT